MGTPICLDESRGLDQASLDIDYNEIIYMITRIVDPSCIGVVELVCNKIDSKKNLIVAQYGCGWSILNLFMQPFPADIAEGPENAVSLSVPIYFGSPRDLVLDNDTKTLMTRLKEIPASKLYFRLFSHRKLIPMARLVSENQLIGKYELVAGLMLKSVVPPGATKSSLLACIGEEQIQIGKKGVVSAPAKPAIAVPLSLHLEDCYIYIQDRLAMETRMRTALLKSFNAASSNELRILSRTLKIGTPSFSHISFNC